MKLEVGKKYKTLSGGVTTINQICNNISLCGNGLVTIFKNTVDILYLENGTCLTRGGSDIVSEYAEPKTLSGWINVYKSGEISKIYDTKKTANHYAKVKKGVLSYDKSAGARTERIACIDLSQFNEGEGL